MFSDGYANAVVSPVKTILTRLYPDWLDPAKSENGTIFGAVGFAGSEFGPESAPFKPPTFLHAGGSTSHATDVPLNPRCGGVLTGSGCRHALVRPYF